MNLTRFHKLGPSPLTRYFAIERRRPVALKFIAASLHQTPQVKKLFRIQPDAEYKKPFRFSPATVANKTPEQA
jgi:hypothetical protein